MGRQILFYMLPEDQHEFLTFVQSSPDILVCSREGDSKDVEAIDIGNIPAGATLCLWNRTVQSRLERKWIPDPGYFRINSLAESVLEYSPSFSNIWRRRPALGQGRLFGNFETYLNKPDGLLKWYESLAKWIRSHYQKNPNRVGGYIGPVAQQFAKEGGYLLPNFLPPETPEWIETISP